MLLINLAGLKGDFGPGDAIVVDTEGERLVFHRSEWLAA
jgi:hypothetical protein